MRPAAIICAVWVAGTIACGFTATPAAAQDANAAVLDTLAPPANPADAPDPQAATPDPQAETPLTPEEAAALGQALMFDPDNYGECQTRQAAAPARSEQLRQIRRQPAPANRTAPARWWSSSRWRANGTPRSAPISTSRRRRRTAIGRTSRCRRPPTAQDSGAAWASVGVPNLATVDARVDPNNDQGKLGTTFKHSIPVDGQFSLTLQDSYSVTQTVGAPTAAPSPVPLMTAPVATAAPAPTQQVWGNQSAVKVDVMATGTSFGAGIVTASNDPVTHNTLSADQKLYGPLHVTTAVTDFGQPTVSKRITAGLKLNW